MTKVTVGMPVFNGANFISQAIESILSQSFGDFELFISDNASEDGTEEICQRFVRMDPRVRYLRQARNVGAAANHNLLFTQSSSSYFKWASHDDVLHSHFLEEAVAALDAHPDVVLASPASALIDELGQPLRFSAERRGMVDLSGVCWPTLPEDNPGLTASDPATRFKAVMLKTVMCVEVYGLMRRSALKKTSLIGAFSASDKVLLSQMALLGPYWLGSEVLFYRRCHAQQYSVRSSGTDRAVWYSGRKDSLLVQQLKLLRAYCRSANMEQLSITDRIQCFVAIGRRAVLRGHQLRRLTSGLVGSS